jgi:hypothetical protein
VGVPSTAAIFTSSSASLLPAGHSTAQHSTAQHSTAQHSTAQHSTAASTAQQQHESQHKVEKHPHPPKSMNWARVAQQTMHSFHAQHEQAVGEDVAVQHQRKPLARQTTQPGAAAATVCHNSCTHACTPTREQRPQVVQLSHNSAQCKQVDRCRVV